MQYSRPTLFHYLAAALVANILTLYFNGYGADLGYWEGWTKQLATNGYFNFDGNYPPVYIHWLYAVGKLFLWQQWQIEPNDLAKFFWQIPVIISHLALVVLAYKLSSSKSQPTTLLLWFTALNPAILFNGPIWGQVDLLPPVIAIAGIICHFSRSTAVFSIPLFVISLLTKFQMIGFAPVFGILFFDNWRAHIKGIALSIICIIIAFSPFIAVHYHTAAFKQAYINTLGQYPVITMNAANFWNYFVGNNTPDNITLLPQIHPFFPKSLTQPKYLGMLIFSAISLSVFILGLNKVISANKRFNLEDALFLSVVCALSFFTFLPAMHERYMFPAVIAALLYSAYSGKGYLYTIAFSLICFANMAIISAINGSDLWAGLSIAVIVLTFIAILEMMAGKAISSTIVEFIYKCCATPVRFLLFSAFCITLQSCYLIDRHSLHKLPISKDAVLLTNIPVTTATQDYSTLHINKSVDGNTLSVGNRKYANGLGTHANSIVEYTIPKNVTRFSTYYGLDDEVGRAEVTFELLVDGRSVWISPTIYGNEKALKTSIDITNAKTLTLKVNSMGETNWDHVDWVYPHFH